MKKTREEEFTTEFFLSVGAGLSGHFPAKKILNFGHVDGQTMKREIVKRSRFYSTPRKYRRHERLIFSSLPFLLEICSQIGTTNTKSAQLRDESFAGPCKQTFEENL